MINKTVKRSYGILIGPRRCFNLHRYFDILVTIYSALSTFKCEYSKRRYTFIGSWVHWKFLNEKIQLDSKIS